jgi:hypothetical protein
MTNDESLANDAYRVSDIDLATTLLDPEEYPREFLAELYLDRWGVEQRFRDIKISMGADVLRCKSPAMIEKEVCINAIGHNLTRCIMQESAQRHDVPLGQISDKGPLDTMRHIADVRKRRPKNFPLMTKPRHQYYPVKHGKNSGPSEP